MSVEAGPGRSGLHLRAHAKLNMGLAVLGRRPDGFHEIDTLFARIDLHDEIWLQKADGLSGDLVDAPDGRGVPDGPAIGEDVPATDVPATDTPAVDAPAVDAPALDTLAMDDLAMDDGNLAMQAARLYLEELRGNAGGEAEDPVLAAAGVRVRLLKRIPLAAGLGGGSSDAAAVLLGMRRLYPARVDIRSLAERLGSDVPFFVEAACCARGRGRGDRLEPLDLPAVPVVLVNPGLRISSAAAYRQIDSFGPPLDVEGIVGALASGSPPAWRNDLQPGVLASCPEVGVVLEALTDCGLQGPLMSGSGSSCFAVARSEATAREAALRLAGDRPDWFVWTGWAAGGSS